jgi:ankyrin repeat protein
MNTDPIGPRSPSSPPPGGAGGELVEADSAGEPDAAAGKRPRDDDGPPSDAARRLRPESQITAPRRSLASALTAARIAKLGRGPYNATCGISGVDLNVKVSVRPEVDFATGLAAGPAEKVECRHLALWFTKAAKKSALMADFSSPGGVAKHFDGTLAAAHADFFRTIAETDQAAKHVVSSRQLGEYLAAVAEALQTADGRQAPAEANCLLTTATHAMAIHVARKSKDGVDYFAVKVYDPNDTANYKRVEVQRPEDLEHLQLADMLVGGQATVDAYGPPGNPGAVVSMAATCLTEGLRPLTDRTRTEATAENMCMALTTGARDEVRAMVQAAGSMPQDELFHLLQAQAARSGLLGNHLALERGHAETVKEFADFVVSSALPPDRQVALLAAKDQIGAPGLAFALQDGRGETVKAFADAVLRSALAPHRQTELLAAKTPEGVPGLVLALQQGCTEAVRIFAEAVLCSALAPDRQVELLSARLPDGAPGLVFAFQQGRSETLRRFADAVLGSALAPDQQAGLLAAKDQNGVPGLLFALQDGCAETVREFADAVLGSALALHRQVDLLAAKMPNGIPGLAMALQEGQAHTVREFADAVLGSALAADLRASLLAAKLANGVPALALALKNGHADAVVRFAEAVLSSALAPDQQAELLAARRADGVPGLIAALTSGSAETVTAFVQAVTGSTRLGLGRQVELLRAELPGAHGGGSALSWATENNHALGADAFREAVLASPLPDDAKSELLSG